MPVDGVAPGTAAAPSQQTTLGQEVGPHVACMDSWASAGHGHSQGEATHPVRAQWEGDQADNVRMHCSQQEALSALAPHYKNVGSLWLYAGAQLGHSATGPRVMGGSGAPQQVLDSDAAGSLWWDDLSGILHSGACLSGHPKSTSFLG